MSDHYAGLGFGKRGIEGVDYIRSMLGASVLGRERITMRDWESPGFVVTIPDDDVGTPIIGRYVHDDLASAHKPPLYLLLLVDESDPVAINDAVIAGARAREASVYLTMAVCVGAVTPVTRAGLRKSPSMRGLRQAVDCLVFAAPMKWNAARVEPGTRAALALISTLLPKVVNLICTDLADMKQVLRGHVHASLAHIPLAHVHDEELPVDITDHLHIKTNGALVHGMFCAYGAPPDDFRLVDFEATCTSVREILDAAHPNADGELLAAALLDSSLTNVAEVVACVAFDDISTM
ncbi:MAG: hypothetical protein ACYDC8_05630 [Gammaproteobacteria bacterium]